MERVLNLGDLASNLDSVPKWLYVQNRNRFTDTENRLRIAKKRKGGVGWSGSLQSVDAT